MLQIEEYEDFVRESIKKQQEIVCNAGKQLKSSKLVAGTWGNISAKVNENLFVVTPSGAEYNSLNPLDMVVVDKDTLEWFGKRNPSSEMKLHARIYQIRKDVGAIIHTHSMNASTVAAARREVPPILDDMAQIIGPSIRVAKYSLPGTKKLVKQTVKSLRGRNAVLLANHGALGVGRDMEEAFTVCEVLEKSCKAFIEAEFLGGAKSINKIEAWIMHKYYLKKYSKQ